MRARTLANFSTEAFPAENVRGLSSCGVPSSRESSSRLSPTTTDLGREIGRDLLPLRYGRGRGLSWGWPNGSLENTLFQTSWI